MRELFNPLIKSSGTLTDPAAETKSIGLPADALVPHFLLLSGQFYRDPKLIVHLPGLAKNAAPRHRRQLIKPPGRYKKYAAGMSIFGCPHCK